PGAASERVVRVSGAVAVRIGEADEVADRVVREEGAGAQGVGRPDLTVQGVVLDHGGTAEGIHDPSEIADRVELVVRHGRLLWPRRVVRIRGNLGDATIQAVVDVSRDGAQR